MSDSKEVKRLEARIQELEKLNVMKQIEIDFKSKMIDIAEEMYGIDLRKNYEKSKFSKTDPSEEQS